MVNSDNQTYNTLWKGTAKVSKIFPDGLVYCEEITINKQIPFPVISDKSKIRIGFGVIYKFCHDIKISNFIFNWYNLDKTSQNISAVQEFIEYCASKKKEKNELYVLAGSMGYALKSHLSKNDEESHEWLKYWISKICWAGCFFAKKNKVEFNLIEIIEKVLSDRKCYPS